MEVNLQHCAQCFTMARHTDFLPTQYVSIKIKEKQMNKQQYKYVVYQMRPMNSNVHKVVFVKPSVNKVYLCQISEGLCSNVRENRPLLKKLVLSSLKCPSGARDKYLVVSVPVHCTWYCSTYHLIRSLAKKQK